MATMGFAPPEQYVSGFGKNMTGNFLADIYGFGAVFLYMLTGIYREAFDLGEAETLLQKKSIDDRIISIISNARRRFNCNFQSETEVSFLLTLYNFVVLLEY